MSSPLYLIRSKWMETGFQKYFKNLSWMLATKVFTMVVSLGTTLYIARRLGPTNFGELDYAIAIVGLFAWIGSWGIDTVLNRELVKQPEQRDVLVGTAIILRFSFGALATLITVIYAILFADESVSKSLILLLSITAIISAPQILQHNFYSRAESKYPSLISMFVVLFASSTKIILISTGQGVVFLAGAMILEQILYTSSYLFLYKKKLDGVFRNWKFSNKIATILIKTGTAIAFLSLFSIIYSRIDQVMIKHLLSAEQVGLYSAGVRLVEIWGFIPTVVLGGLYPAVLNARKVSESYYNKRLRQTLVLLMLPAIFASVVLFTFAHSLLELVFGPAFVAGSTSLQIYGLSIPAMFLGYFVMQVLHTDDYRKMLITITAIPAILNVILNYYFIPHYGIVGAAWATLISCCLVPIIPFMFNSTRIKFLSILRK